MENCCFSFTQRLKRLCTPAKDLSMATIKKTSNQEAFQTFTDLFTLRKTKLAGEDDRAQSVRSVF